MILQILNHAARAVSRLISQFADKPKLVGLTRALGNEAQAVEDAVYPLSGGRALSATGAQLDTLGRLVGAPARNGLSDLDYRRKIELQILVNKSQGTDADVYTIAKRAVTAWNVSGQPVVIDQQPACVEVSQQPPGGALVNSDSEGAECARLLSDALPAGVRVIVYSTQVAPAARFQLDTAGQGLDQGVFVAAYDGSQ